MDCTICKEPIRSPHVLNCGHMACATCLYAWISKHNACHACRVEVKSVIPVYQDGFVNEPDDNEKVIIEKLSEIGKPKPLTRTGFARSLPFFYRLIYRLIYPFQLLSEYLFKGRFDSSTFHRRTAYFLIELNDLLLEGSGMNKKKYEELIKSKFSFTEMGRFSRMLESLGKDEENNDDCDIMFGILIDILEKKDLNPEDWVLGFSRKLERV